MRSTTLGRADVLDICFLMGLPQKSWVQNQARPEQLFVCNPTTELIVSGSKSFDRSISCQAKDWEQCVVLPEIVAG